MKTGWWQSLQRSTCTKLLSAILAGTLLLAGCTGAKPNQPADAKAAAKNEKPPLQIPSSFANDGEKLTFAVKAMGDGYYKEIAPLLEQTANAAPSATAYSALGVAKYNLGDEAAAIQAWSKAAELDPKVAAEMSNNIGNALRDSKKLPEAEDAYRKAIKLDPHQWNAAINLATILLQQNKKSDAVAVLEAAVPANPNIEPLVKLLDSYKSQVKAG
jgi:tetratricopeptide (TPR) repeat protein